MDDLGTFERHGENVDLRYERYYLRPIETVWAALTDAERLNDWLGQARIEPRLGGYYELFTDRARPMTGRILTWDPPRVLEYSWDTGDAPATVVRWELAPDGAGTRLILTHKGMGFAWSGLVLPGWHVHLEQLASLLQGEAHPPMMERWRAMQKTYLDHYNIEGVLLEPPAGHCS